MVRWPLPWHVRVQRTCTLVLRRSALHLAVCACCCARQDVLLYLGASVYGKGPPALGTRSPRQSFNPEHPDFSRERGSYQTPFAEP